MTIAAVARELMVGERQVTRWRNGQQPRHKFVVALAELFERDTAWFYTEHTTERAAA